MLKKYTVENWKNGILHFVSELFLINVKLFFAMQISLLVKNRAIQSRFLKINLIRLDRLNFVNTVIYGLFFKFFGKLFFL